MQSIWLKVVILSLCAKMSNFDSTEELKLVIFYVQKVIANFEVTCRSIVKEILFSLSQDLSLLSRFLAVLNKASCEDNHKFKEHS